MARNKLCCSSTTSTRQKVRKGLWSPEEDEKLNNYITRNGAGCWSSVPKLAGLQRCGKSCRLRWINYLRPDLKRGMFLQHEEELIVSLHKLLGNRWAQIAAQLPGRTDNEIKNFWNSFLKKKLISQGIDPSTHKPLFDNKEPTHETNSNSRIISSAEETSEILEYTEKASTCNGTKFPLDETRYSNVFTFMESKPMFDVSLASSSFMAEYVSNVISDSFHHAMRPCSQFTTCPPPAMPSFLNFDQGRLEEVECSESYSEIQINHNYRNISAEHSGNCSWADSGKKLEPLFQDFSGGIMKSEEENPSSWNQTSDDLISYKAFSVLEDFTEVNFEVFQQI